MQISIKRGRIITKMSFAKPVKICMNRRLLKKIKNDSIIHVTCVIFNT
jgi:hypothetical protein